MVQYVQLSLSGTFICTLIAGFEYNQLPGTLSADLMKHEVLVNLHACLSFNLKIGSHNVKPRTKHICGSQITFGSMAPKSSAANLDDSSSSTDEKNQGLHPEGESSLGPSSSASFRSCGSSGSGGKGLQRLLHPVPGHQGFLLVLHQLMLWLLRERRRRRRKKRRR